MLIAQNWRLRGGVLFDLDKYKYDQRALPHAVRRLSDRACDDDAACLSPIAGCSRRRRPRFGLNYTDECTIFDVSYTQSYADRQAGSTKDTRTVMFRLELRTLGEISYSQSLDGQTVGDGVTSSTR